jgi:hypothetical protein
VEGSGTGVITAAECNGEPQAGNSLDQTIAIAGVGRVVSAMDLAVDQPWILAQLNEAIPERRQRGVGHLTDCSAEDRENGEVRRVPELWVKTIAGLLLSGVFEQVHLCTAS